MKKFPKELNGGDLKSILVIFNFSAEWEIIIIMMEDFHWALFLGLALYGVLYTDDLIQSS